MLTRFLGEMPFGEFLAAGAHGVGFLVDLQMICVHDCQLTKVVIPIRDTATSKCDLEIKRSSSTSLSRLLIKESQLFGSQMVESL